MQGNRQPQHGLPDCPSAARGPCSLTEREALSDMADRLRRPVRRENPSCGAGRVQQPHPRRQCRWHVEHGLTHGNELLGQQRAQPGCLLDGPRSWRKTRREGQHAIALITGSGEPELGNHRLAAIQYRCCVRRLGRS